MIEHKIWRGERYGERLHGGKTVALMGYSHWDDAGDHEDKTVDTIEALIEGKPAANFFSTVRNYFGSDPHGDFWPTVLFFNYVPNFVGDGDARYKNATPAQYEQAELRFLRIMDEHKPDVLLAFSRKVDERLPNGFVEAPTRLKSGHSHGFYDTAGHRMHVALLPHPQGADGGLMRAAVAEMIGGSR